MIELPAAIDNLFWFLTGVFLTIAVGLMVLRWQEQQKVKELWINRPDHALAQYALGLAVQAGRHAANPPTAPAPPPDSGQADGPTADPLTDQPKPE